MIGEVDYVFLNVSRLSDFNEILVHVPLTLTTAYLID